MTRVRPRRLPRLRLREQPARRGAGGGRRGRVLVSRVRPGVHPAAVLPRDRPVPLGGALGRSGRHRGDRRASSRRSFPDDVLLQRWLELAPGRVAFQGLPARICWLGYGDRARAGLAINELVRSGAVSAPVVIGRDHLDSGSVASPYRETEAMRDGSDAIADWPILNALAQRRRGRDLGQRPPRRRRRDRQLDPRRHGRRRRRHATPLPSGSSACSRPIPARASCATPTRATTRRSTRRASTGIDLPSIDR